MLAVFTTTFINPTAVFLLCIITLGSFTLFFKRIVYLKSIWMASHALMLKFALSNATCAVLMVAAALAVGSRALRSNEHEVSHIGIRAPDLGSFQRITIGHARRAGLDALDVRTALRFRR